MTEFDINNFAINNNYLGHNFKLLSKYNMICLICKIKCFIIMGELCHYEDNDKISPMIYTCKEILIKNLIE